MAQEEINKCCDIESIMMNVEIQQNGIIRNEKGRYIGNLLKDIEFEGEFVKNLHKKQPKKIPYTLETFPENALWIRNIEWNKFVRKRFDLCFEGLKFFRLDEIEILKFGEIHENYEIGCQVIKGGKIEIEWLPFYQEV